MNYAACILKSCEGWGRPSAEAFVLGPIVSSDRVEAILALHPLVVRATVSFK